MHWNKDDFLITDDRARLDVEFIHHFLSRTYWAKDIPIDVVRKSIEGSLCFGIFHKKESVGFARVVTDRATFAYLADVFVIETYRGQALGKWLMACIMEHPELQGLRRWILATADAHELYKQYGFIPLNNPEIYMEITIPDIYKKGSE